MKGTEEQALKEYKSEIVLDNDGLIVPDSDIGIDGFYFDKETGKFVNFMDDNYIIDDTAGSVLLDINVYKQIISIPKDIDGNTVYLELNPSNDFKSCLDEFIANSEDGDEYLIVERYDEVMP